MYILDTSAIRGIKRENLQRLSENDEVVISTLSVLELASHLHDSADNVSYLRARGNFLKCSDLKILEDPFWQFAVATGMASHQSRKYEAQDLERLISHVQGYEKIEELDLSRIRGINGEEQTCKDLGIRIREILHEEENKFVKQIQLYADKLGFKTPKLEDKKLEVSELLQTLIGFSKGFGDDEVVFLAAFKSASLYAGYLTSRLYHYANARQKGTVELNVDPNDCEDAYICLHLDLLANNTLVTNDKGTITALNEVISLLNQVLPKPIATKFVMDVEELTASMLGD